MPKLIIVLAMLLISSNLHSQLNHKGMTFEASVGGGTLVTSLTEDSKWGAGQKFGIRVRFGTQYNTDILLTAGIQRLSGLNETYVNTEEVFENGENARVGIFYHLSSLGMGFLGAGVNRKIDKEHFWGILIGAKASYQITARIKNYNSIWNYNIVTNDDGESFTRHRGSSIGYTSLGTSNPTLSAFNLIPYFGLSREVVKGVNVELTASQYLFNLYKKGNVFNTDRRPTLLDVNLSIRL